ncbi:MAG TPA: crossover junction endodeoxyribonuclease RuvC [Chloroflexia bacterium]|nr:crossover junction endodeoxyribonuclease RuvC [Chloroflexia bacterium]
MVLGIDPGTAIMGYGLVSHASAVQDEPPGGAAWLGMAGLQAGEFGALRTPAHMPLVERLPRLYAGLIDILREFQPGAVAIEELFFGRNVTTAISVGQARGVAVLAAAHCGLPIAEYTPMQVKQAVVGYGKATKDQVQQMVRMLLNLETVPQPDDAADALAIAICHLHTRSLDSLIARQVR